ncbi:MAG TPA: hypothetical protein PK079_25905 [Leptospiraceae bacterium]|nr:hypothetical protein [Leptospiraceae bacterium]HNC59920.1 hypothetical protein [Leptospiraceae bacterium]HNE56625.1 hypothetical protein [Leptospiraceae bacterium]HNF57581.1 hypothetical protein [Leptospiraceae bacterium]
MPLYKMHFKSPCGSFEGELLVAPEPDDRNDAGYDALIPEGSHIHMEKLFTEEGLAILAKDLKHKGNY